MNGLMDQLKGIVFRHFYQVISGEKKGGAKARSPWKGIMYAMFGIFTPVYVIFRAAAPTSSIALHEHPRRVSRHLLDINARSKQKS